MAEEHDALSVQVVHASPGRLRLRVPRGALENGALNRVEQALTGVAGVQQVRPNALASSLVVSFDDGVVGPAALLDTLSRAGVTVDPSAPAPAPTAERSRVGLSIESFFGTADSRVAGLTGGNVDLRTLVPIGLGALALREVMAGRVGMAPWYTLAWWAFDAFYKLHVTRMLQRLPEE